MSKSQIFPAILILLDIGAAVVYLAADRDFNRCGYWLSAACITFFATFQLR